MTLNHVRNLLDLCDLVACRTKSLGGASLNIGAQHFRAAESKFIHIDLGALRALKPTEVNINERMLSASFVP